MKFLLLAVLITVVSCASTHPGRMGDEIHKQKQEELLVSAELVSDYSDPTLSFINVTMENTSDSWIRIKSAEFSCGEECNDKVNVIVGNDLITWAKSKKEKMAIDEYNAELLRGGLTVGGTVLAILGTDSTTVTAGAAIAGAGLIGSSIHGISKERSQLETSRWVPDEHIYSATNVPTSLFTRKWLLVNHPKGYKMKAFLLRLKTIDDQELTYVFRI